MDLFTLDNLFTLAMLILLQAVLGFDNLLYISIESKRVEPSRQAYVRRMGIGLAIVFRIVLLFVVLRAVAALQEPAFSLSMTGVVTGAFNLHAIVSILGGVFIMYTAVKEIMHMLAVEDLTAMQGNGGPKSVAKVIALIVSVNLVFSFDSILSAMALSDVFAVMATAIVISGIMMIWLSDHVSAFLERNRMYEVLGLFILFIVGILLLSEGGHMAHLTLFGFPVEAMSKSTFYFVIAVLVLVDIVQGRYRKKLMKQRAVELG